MSLSHIHSPGALDISAICTQRPSITTSLEDVTNKFAQKLPCRILFKNEHEQPSGSFKLRGIGHLIQQSILLAQKQNKTEIHVFASSGGNAGLAAAYAAQLYKVSCTVVVPATTLPHIVTKLRRYGSEVVLCGASINEADLHARQLMAESSPEKYAVYCHPFDNPLIWEGHSQIVEEIFEQVPSHEHHKIRAIACSVGGGGLYNGVITGLRSRGSSASCLLVETKQAPTLSLAVRAGSVVNLQLPRSLATSLACSYVSAETLDKFHDQSVNQSFLKVIDDLDAVRSMLAYQREFGTIVEPACGAALDLVYGNSDFIKQSLPDLAEDDIVVVIVCGGSCVNEATVPAFRKLVRESRI